MKEFLMINTGLHVLFIFMHEFDAIKEGEWKMFGFLRLFSDRMQYLIFLYLHIPICLLYFYFLWTSWNFQDRTFWIIMNAIGVFHLPLHLFASTWKTNVFKSFSSFLFISCCAITGAINLSLWKFY